MFQELLARIKTIGLATPNRFRVLMTPPSSAMATTEVTIGGELVNALLTNPNTPAFRDSTYQLALLAESTLIPGKSFLTTDRQIYGPSYKVAYNALYNEVPFTFNVDMAMFPKTLFDQWQEMVQNPATNDMNFYNEYTTDIVIQQLDKSNNVIYSIKLIEAWPVTVNDMTLDYNITDSTHKLAVTFAYRYWQKI